MASPPLWPLHRVSALVHFADTKVIIGGSVAIVVGVVILVALLVAWRKLRRSTGDDAAVLIGS